MAVRKIIRIDEEKCDGCGQCVIACPEGAIVIIDGKARLISETYCDGLGACIGECPQGAITIEEREAEPFNGEAVEKRLKESESMANVGSEELPCGCPGSASQVIERCELQEAKGRPPSNEAGEIKSTLQNWPVQIQLVPPKAPYFEGAHLLIAADCVPFAFADFHRKLLANRVLIVGCPKLDNADFYRRKIAQIIIQNEIRAIDVAYMEVPCCFGLVHLVHESLKESGKDIPLRLVKVGIEGEVLEIIDARKGGDI